MNELQLAFAFDKNYLMPFFALTRSLMVTCKPETIHMHIILGELSDAEVAGVKSHLKGFAKVHFYTLDQELVRKFVLTSKWTATAYYRIFFPFLVPEKIEKLLYLDCDTIVLKNIDELYDVDLGQFPLAAVYDNYVKIQPLIGIKEEGNYFNSGVLLINLKKWRDQKISEKSIEYLLQYPDNIKFVDQCALNFVLKDNWKKIDPKFNLLYSYLPNPITNQELKFYEANTYIVHFTLQRPWEMLCQNPFRKFYYKYSNSNFLNRYNDFAWTKIPAWFRIRVLELYTNLPVAKRIWRFIKNL